MRMKTAACFLKDTSRHPYIPYDWQVQLNTVRELELFRKRLQSMPHDWLVEAVVRYACGDYDFWKHIDVLLQLTPADPGFCLEHVRDRIDQIYGDEDIPYRLDRKQVSRFLQVPDLIEQLLKLGLNEQAVRAAEHAFTYAENIGGVMDPDDFVDQCYGSIIVFWIRGCRGMGMTAEEIGTRLSLLEQYDEYGVFAGVESLHAREVGEEALAPLKPIVRG